MNRLHVLLLSSFILIFSTAENIPAQDTTVKNFLPLKIGNRWTYSHTNGWPPSNYRFLSEVLRDTIFNSHKFFYLTYSKYITGNNDGGWVRIDSFSGNVYYFNPSSSNQCIRSGDALWDSLKSQIHDTSYLCVQYPGPARHCAILGSTYIFGLNREYKTFEGFSVGSDYRKYVKDIGITNSTYGELHADIYYLLGCVINGIVFGDTSMTGINKISSEVPERFSLSQNYPNPFNPTTKIRFSIAIPPLLSPKGRESDIVILKIYDILGREVATLVNEKLSPGTYEVDFDGSNLPSGVYYYTLNTGNYIETKKMVLMK